MSLEQTLNKLQSTIHETLPNLELFVDGTVQPSSQDCENLQKQLQKLQEHLNVFKYLKTNKEISPSFGIHSKVSEVIKQEEQTKIAEPIKETELRSPIELVATPELNHEAKKLEITLNQKFQFINELFNQNATEYGLAIDQLNECATWQDADSYLLSLKSVYNWKDANETYKRLKEITKKRFE
jgi:preprotein translocase subunit YajC